MGGICGIIVRGGSVDSTILDLMVAPVPYRSSNSVDRHTAGLAALAHLTHLGAAEEARIAVHPATGVAVVADARLDNGAEVRRSLGATAPPPEAAAAELVLATYLRWGTDGFERLLGDFAIAAWDPRSHQLALARDPMSMRPLYFRVEAERALFASEVRQLTAVPGVPEELDERMLAAYLASCFGDSSWTYFRGIEQVPPGQVTTVVGTTVRSHRFWDVDPARQPAYEDERECQEHFRELFLEAVRARTASARSTGVLLSGGIDSGAAAASIGWLRERGEPIGPIHAYSFDFGSVEECDERHVSRHIVDRYGFAPTDIPVEDAGPLADYPGTVQHPDDPFDGYFQTALDRSFAQARRDGIEVIFTGMRGDLIAGPLPESYETLLRSWRLLALLGELRRQRLTTKETISSMTRRDVLPLAILQGRRSTGAGWLRWAVRRSSQRPPFRRPSSPRHTLPPWIDPAFAHRTDLEALLRSFETEPTPDLAGPLRRSRYRSVFSPMIMRWAVSQERRVAGLGSEVVDAWSDRRIVEWSVLAPQQAINRPGRSDKRLVRESLSGVLPPPFLQSARKTIPTPLFVKTLATRVVPTVHELLTDARTERAGWIRARPLREGFDRFVSGTGPLPDGFWWAISLERWLRMRESGQSSGPPAHVDRHVP